jgi:hypothetical protein
MWRGSTETLAILAAGLLVTGCATTHAPRLTASQAIDLAAVEATRQHFDTRRFMPPTAYYRPEGARWIWVVHWDEKPDKAGMVRIGGDCWAFVDDASGHVTVQGGF